MFKEVISRRSEGFSSEADCLKEIWADLSDPGVAPISRMLRNFTTLVPFFVSKSEPRGRGQACSCQSLWRAAAPPPTPRSEVITMKRRGIRGKTPAKDMRAADQMVFQCNSPPRSAGGDIDFWEKSDSCWPGWCFWEAFEKLLATIHSMTFDGSVICVIWTFVVF